MSTRIALVLFLVLGVAPVRAVQAYDVALDAETLFRAYEVRGPVTSTSWLRRRVVQDLQLQVTQALQAPRADRDVPLLRAVVQLRLSQDVGDTCFVSTEERCFDAADARAASTYHPLAEDGVLDAMLAYVDVSRGPGQLQARAGRQLWIDPVGFARVDGVSVRAAPLAWLSLAAFGGLQTRGTSVGATSGFEPQGVLRLNLSERQQLLAGYVAPPAHTALFAGHLELGDARWVRAQLSVREVFDRDGLVMRRLGAALRSSPVPSLHLSSSAVVDATGGELLLGHILAHWQLQAVSMRASVETMRPTFDLGSIWAYLPTAAVQQAELGASVQASGTTSLGGGLRGRATAMPGADEHDAGLHGFVSTRAGGVDVAADAYVWLGDLGDLWGAELGAAKPWNDRLRTELGVSLQRVNDPARVDFDGVSIAQWMRAAWRITPRTDAALEVSHAYNRFVRHRFSVLASMQLGAWR